jgi:hypothetical protein
VNVAKQFPFQESNVMNDFIGRYWNVIVGALNGFDRLLFRGSLRNLSRVDGLAKFLNWKRIKLVEFRSFCESVTEGVQSAAEKLAKETGCRSEYLRSTSLSKEELARWSASQTGSHGPHGLVCILRCVEPCWSYELYRNAETKRLEPRSAQRKCLHYYFYFQHPQLGWMHIRIQSWLPLMVRICLNGREWLARQMTNAGIPFIQKNNCFVQISDFEKAQGLATRQLRTAWPELLDQLLAIVHPLQQQLYPDGWPYYWSAEQTEWATDLLFKTPEDLSRCYPHFLRHMAYDVTSADVLRFLGRKTKLDGQIMANFSGDVQSVMKPRPEGTRIKHQLNQNWIKMYDKEGIILRTETTINNPYEFKAFRTSENDPDGKPEWRILRKGVADLNRRAEVSQAANNRYIQTLADVESPETFAETVEPICHRTSWHGRPIRALNPLAPDDARLLEAVSQGEFALNGFRNADLRRLLYSTSAKTKAEEKKRAAAVTRKLQILRAHSLIQKVPTTQRYTLTTKGAKIITATLVARRSTTVKQTHLSA